MVSDQSSVISDPSGGRECVTPSSQCIELPRPVTLSRTAAFLAELDLADIETETDSPRLRQSVVIAQARSYGLTACGAMYLELALRRGAPPATFDSQLANATRKAGGRVFGDRPCRFLFLALLLECRIGQQPLQFSPHGIGRIGRGDEEVDVVGGQRIGALE